MNSKPPPCETGIDGPLAGAAEHSMVGDVGGRFPINAHDAESGSTAWAPSESAPTPDTSCAPPVANEEYHDWDPQAISWGLLIGNLVGNLLPLLSVGVGVHYAWHKGFGWPMVAITVVMYVVTALGITVGFHRLFTHRAFKTGPAVTLMAGILGSMALQGPVIQWVGMHRLHHQYSDKRGDPHSPYILGTTVLGGLWGFLHAHMLWMLKNEVPSYRKYVKDLEANPWVVFVDRLFMTWVLLGLAIPAAVSGLIYGTWLGVWMGFLWGGLIRIFLLHQVTYSINSVCHLWGRRSFRTRDDSRDNWLLGWLGLGEGWHNGHHAFPTSARHGLLAGQFDFSYAVICVLERLGLAKDVIVPTREDIRVRRENLAIPSRLADASPRPSRPC